MQHSRNSRRGTDADSAAQMKSHLRQILQALKDVRQGHFNVRVSIQENGTIGEIVTALNEVIGLKEKMTNEFVRISKTVGREGKMTEQATGRISTHRNHGKWNG